MADEWALDFHLTRVRSDGSDGSTTGNETPDVQNYAEAHADFPHQTTADQFFSESQFESYRMLGAYTMDQLCTECGGDFRSFIRHILERHLKMQPPEWLQN